MTFKPAFDIAAATAQVLHREYPELVVRDGGTGTGNVDLGLRVLVNWLVERIGADEGAARAGAERICEELLADGFPRRPLIRAIGLLRVELAWSGGLDPAAVSRVTTGLYDVLMHRLLPGGAVDATTRSGTLADVA